MTHYTKSFHSDKAALGARCMESVLPDQKFCKCSNAKEYNIHYSPICYTTFVLTKC